MNTTFLLMAEFETSQIPLKDVAERYMRMDYKRACEKAAKQSLPFPVYRCGSSQKAPWLVSVNDLAKYLDAERDRHTHDHERIQRAS